MHRKSGASIVVSAQQYLFYYARSLKIGTDKEEEKMIATIINAVAIVIGGY